MNEQLRQLLEKSERLATKADFGPFTWQQAFSELVADLRQAEHEAALEPGVPSNGHNDHGYVYVVKPEFGDGELYVFGNDEDAEAFVEARGSGEVSEEPILDAEFVAMTREGHVQ